MRKILTLLAAAAVLFPVAASAVTVGPPRLEYKADPGQSFAGTMFLQNEGDTTKTFYPDFQTFTERNGEKVFLKEESDLASWFRMPQSLTLEPDEKVDIPFTIEVPRDAAPGGHFAVIWWGAAANPKSGEQVAIVTRAGVLVYFTVSGDVKEAGAISRFDTGRTLFAEPPVAFDIEFANSGNVALKPMGQISMRNLFGGGNTTVPVNQNGAIVLPGTSKTLSAELAHGNFFGPYRAELALAYGENELSAKSSVWLFFFPPLKTAIAVIILLLIVFLPAILRRYNAWIINKSRAQS